MPNTCMKIIMHIPEPKPAAHELDAKDIWADLLPQALTSEHRGLSSTSSGPLQLYFY